MHKMRTSIAAKLVVGYGLLGIASILVICGVLYVGTIGVLDQDIDKKISALSERLATNFGARPTPELAREVTHQLSDGIDSDREIYLVMDRAGHRLAGNLSSWPAAVRSDGSLLKTEVVREGVKTPARITVRVLDDGGMLVVGHDLSEHESIRMLVARALATGAILSLLLTAIGALWFRRQIEKRIGEIRRAAHDIGEGDLSRRIAVSGSDEFSLLNRDINRMLDRIEQLMDGIRHVSNAIAHDLRTPLTRIRNKLDDAVRRDMTVEVLGGAAHSAIDDIDGLIRLFERLLQIAQAEAGVRSQSFESVDLSRIAHDMAEMYEAMAEEGEMRLTVAGSGPVLIQGDRNLLASAVASLIDNAIKYAGAGATVSVTARSQPGGVSIAVQDDGPGIPLEEHAKVVQRFYRLDKSRGLPGNGLGLSIVSAIAQLHGGILRLEDGKPGLTARILLPHHAEAALGGARHA